MRTTSIKARTIAMVTVSILGLGLAACSQAATEKADAATAQASASATPDAATSGLTLVTSQPPVVGQPVTVTLNLKGPDGKPLGPDAIAIKHENKVHVMLVDSGLEDYTHVHATPGANPGEWTVPFTPKFGRTYKVWADYELVGTAPAPKPKGEDHAHGAGSDHSGHNMADMNGMAGMDHGGGGDAHPQTPSVDLLVGSDPAPVIAPTQSLTATIDGITFGLSLGGPLKRNEHVAVTLTVQDAATDQPFAGLEPIMGAYAHLVGFSADGTSMLHGHPEGAEPKDASARGGPALSFDLHPQAAGPTRVFVQIKKGGKVIVAPMTLVVAP